MRAAEILDRLFINRHDAYGLQLPAGAYEKQLAPVNKKLLQFHLDGHLTIGTYQLDADSSVKTLCWDIDDRQDCKAIASKLVHHLKEKHGLNAYNEASGSANSLHVWLFLNPTPARNVRAFGQKVLEEMGLEKIEVFPKQDSMGQDGYGNLIKLPLGVHKKNGNRSQFLHPDTIQPLSLDDTISMLSEVKPCTLPNIETISQEINQNQHNSLELEQVLPKLRPCMKKAFAEKLQLSGAEGHDFRLAIAREMLFNGASDDAIHAFFSCQQDYDHARTQKHVDSLKQNRKPVKCSTLRSKAGSFVNALCSGCVYPEQFKEKDGKQESKKEKDEIAQISFLLLPDGKILEEVYDNSGAKFALWNGKDVEYVEEIRNGRTYKPLVNDAITTGAVKLPACAQDYSTPQELINAILSHVHRYLDVSKDMEVFATWYVLLSWVYDRVNTLPYLRAMGDTGCGKSRFLDVIGGLCYKACMVSGAITPAPIYRMIKQWGGTIVLDEADFRDSSEKSEVITILNCGFEKNRPVIRCDQNNVDNLQFLPTYCPKVIATRYTFNDKALESRCLTEKMAQTDRKDIPKVLPTKFYEEQQELRNKLLMFRFRHYWLIDGDAGQGLDFGDIEPRLQQATQSFAALFSKVPELMARFKAFLEQYNRELIEERSESFDGMIVQALLRLHGEGRQDISSKDIANKMMEDFGWEKVTAQAVGKHLKSLKIETKQKTGSTVRGVVWDETLINKIRQRYTLPEKTDSNSIRSMCSMYSRGETNFTTNAIDSDSVKTDSVQGSSLQQVPISPIANATNAINAMHCDFNKNQQAPTKTPAQRDRMVSFQKLWEQVKDQPVPKEVLFAWHANQCKIPEDIAASDVEHFLQVKNGSVSTPEPDQMPEQTTLEDRKPEDKQDEETQTIKQAGREWERFKGQAGNNTNITEAVFWVCDKLHLEPSIVRPVLERLFKITPSSNDGSGHTPAPEQKKPHYSYLCKTGSHKDCGGYCCDCNCHKITDNRQKYGVKGTIEDMG